MNTTATMNEQSKTVGNQAERARKVLQEKVVNGVNVGQLMETIRAVQGQPELANFKFRAKNQWTVAAQNRAEVKEYYGLCQELDTRKTPLCSPMTNRRPCWARTKGPTRWK